MSGGGEARVRGQWGEDLVAEDLRQKGWTIVATNFRCRMGELDIVARNERYLVFVEVKLRKNDRYGAACEAVTPAKQTSGCRTILSDESSHRASAPV